MASACVPPSWRKGKLSGFALDLDITLEENRFITKIYNKVDDFDFEVASFPFPTSNM